MNRTFLLAGFLSALALAACTPGADEPLDETPGTPEAAETPPPATQQADASALTPEGWGDLKIGMSRADVEAIVGPTATPDAMPASDDINACDDYQPQRAPLGLFVMLEDNILTRITLAELNDVKTADGFGLGDPADKVKAFYGARAVVTPHKYMDHPAEYITVWSGGPRSESYVEEPDARGLVYEIDGSGNVGAIHAGGPSIQYVEGCA
ncbi:MAG: hypothetical protein R3C46_05505 [Hyphomonadaceae bacterium]